MASVTLTGLLDRFPAGTSIGLYKQSDWNSASLPPAGAPPGVAVATAVIGTDGTLAFTGVGAETDYFIGANLAPWKYVRYTNHASRNPAATSDAVLRARNPLNVLDEPYGGKGDGVSNDTAAINSAVAALPAGGGDVYLPRGTYIVDAATISLRSNLRFLGDGRGLTIIKLRNGANGRMISYTGAALTNVSFEGITFDFNMANQTDGASRDDRAGLFLTAVSHLQIRYCEFMNGRSGAALRLQGCNHTLLLGNYFHDNGQVTTLNGAQTLPLATITVASTAGFASSGQLMVGDNQLVTYTGLTGTTFTGCSGGSGAMPDGAAVIPAVGGSGLQCDHNFNSDADHLRVEANSYYRATDTGTAQDGIQHSTVVGNTYEQNILGISISNSTTRNSRWNTVTGNSIKGGGALFRTSTGIKCSTFGNTAAGNMTDGVIVGNVIHDIDRAIWCEEIDRVVIANNILSDTNASAANKQLMIISSTGTMRDAKINDNKFNNGSTGLRISGGAFAGSNTLVNNEFIACSTVINGTIPTTMSVRENPGYNPQGVVAITVTASPFTYTAGPTPENVFISGGTVSVIAKNGITLYTATNADVWLEPREAVVVTYSVAPTMNADRK